jgi:hypothetical protein
LSCIKEKIPLFSNPIQHKSLCTNKYNAMENR